MSKPLLIIDPGHGGIDPGGGSNHLWKEKDKVLEISLYQYKRFKELGINVALTRNNDKYIDSTPRTNIVKSSGAKYCISNHINAGGGEGAETIHSIHSNGRFATLILDELVKEGAKRRRVFTRKNSSGSDWYFMHRMTGSVETVIIEYGFADNKNDTEKIKNDWKDYAEAVVKAFCKYIGHKYTVSGLKTVKPKTTKTKSSTTTKARAANLYRVRKSWKDVKSQKGAYTVLQFAEATADANKGYKVYDKNGKVVYNPHKSNNSKLKVDGYWGVATTKELQRVLGTTVDGIISRQYKNATTDSLFCKVTYGKGGSMVIKALQKKIGVKQDGYLGPATVRALQKYLGTKQDGIISKPSLMVKELQRRLNNGTF